MNESHAFHQRFSSLGVLLAILCGLVWTGGVRAQDANVGSEATAEAWTSEMIKTRLQSVESSALDEAAKNEAIELYNQALAELEAGNLLRSTRQEWSTRTSAVPDELQKVQEKLSTEPDVSMPATDDMSLADLDAKANALAAELDDAQKQFAALQAEPKQRADQRIEIPKRIAELQDAQAQAEQQYLAAARADTVPAVRDARKALFELKQRNSQLNIDRLQSELDYYKTADELLRKRTEYAKREVDRLSELVQSWKDRADTRRRQEAEEERLARESTASDVAEPLKPLAQLNVKLAAELEQVANEIADASRKQQAIQSSQDNWSQQYTRVQQLVDTELGVTESVGSLLRDQRSELPDPVELGAEIKKRRNLIYEVRSKEFTVTEKLLKFTDPTRRTEIELQTLAQDVSSSELEDLRPALEELLKAQEQTLKALQQNYKKYQDDLVQLNIEQEQLKTLVERYGMFIDEHVLWIRSTRPASLQNVRDVPAALRWLVDPTAWSNLFHALIASMRRNVFLHLALVLAILLCVVYRHHGLRRIVELGELASVRTCRTISVTAQSFLWTLLVSANGPVFFSWLAFVVGDLRNDADLELAVPLATACQRAALVYWPISFWLNALRSHGLAEDHFDWSDHVIRLVRRNLTWFVPIVVPAVVVYYFFESTNHPEWEGSISRFALTVANLCVAIFIRRLADPRRGIWSEHMARYNDGWAWRLRFLWYPALVGIPLTFSFMSLMGYQYTAQRLGECLYTSTVFLSAVYLAEAVSMRWILIKRRGLAIAQARERLAMAQASASGEKVEPNPAQIAELVDLGQVNEQTRRLILGFITAATILGLYFIWIDVLPALGRLNEIGVWQIEVPATATNAANNQAAGITTDGAVASSAPMGATTLQWITLGQFILSIVILVLSWVAVRNIPGLMEIAILQHLPLDASIRYAITTVTRYALILTGGAWAFSNIGFGWSKLQWLVAGVSVGLGFGLQEIFANFVSGLILLFERPLRAGDIVTVGDITGTVVQIKMRATTIQDWDRKELVVPNKEFITSQLLNWTLTDTVNRLVIPVGVAYGSDVSAARAILLAAAKDHPLVLEDPVASVTFDAFGDSSLNLTLRCYLAGLEHRLDVTHELHQDIYQRLADANISIPFPQRDVHLFQHRE